MSERSSSQPASHDSPVAFAAAGESAMIAQTAADTAGALALASTAGSEPLVRGILPAALTPFVGRSRELRMISDLLARDDVRLVTLTGPGGVGKTRLALEVARNLASEFADGVVYVPLAAVQEAPLIASALAQALGLMESDGLPPSDRVTAALRDRRLLLFLDNFEHLAGEAAGTALADLLRAAPGVTALVTSRVLLHLSGEHAFMVPPLALPARDATTLPSLDDLATTEAVQLFVDRACAAWPNFALTAENAPAVVAICHRVDGLPLAIELAAARSAVLSPADLLARLEQRLPLLSGGPRDQPQRLRTMRNAIAWSYDLLDSATQRHLSRLAVFVGGFSLAASEAVAAPASMQETSALDAMAALLTSSLMQRLELPNGETRYVMLETVREFGLEQLARAGDEAAARAAHAAYYLDFMERAEHELWSTTNQALLNRIEVEHDNLRAALTWAIAHDPMTALRLTNGLGAFWSKRCHWTEGRSWLERALATGAGAGSAARAAALGRLGALAGDQGEFTEARRLLSESLQLAEALGESQLVARALRILGIQASNQSDFEQAEALFARSLALFRSLHDQPGIGRCLNDLGLVAERRGDHERAIAYLEEALPIARLVGDDWQTCITLGNLGEAHYDHGDYARGEALFHEALDLARQIGDTFGVAVNLYCLGNCVFNLGDVGGALVRYRESLAQCLDLGERHLASRALDSLGVALHRVGHSRSGARLLGAASALRESIGDALFVEEDAALSARIREVRDRLGAAAYVATWESGRTLPFEQAAREALAQADVALLDFKTAPAQAHAGLTVREAEVLRLLCEGYADKEIGERLFISTRTASSHVQSVLAKLGVDSRTAAVAAAFRKGLV